MPSQQRINTTEKSMTITVVNCICKFTRKLLNYSNNVKLQSMMLNFKTAN